MSLQRPGKWLWGRMMMVPARYIIAACAALALCVAAAPAETITCTNSASSATWQISIDYAHSTVDSNPAEISGSEITWHDAKDGANYKLDRKTGELTAVVPSSTGGYFLHHRCQLRP
jgi:hypothetical protein